MKPKLNYRKPEFFPQEKKLKIVPPLFVRIGTYTITFLIVFLLLIALLTPYYENKGLHAGLISLSGKNIVFVLYTPLRPVHKIHNHQTVTFVVGDNGKEYKLKIDGVRYLCKRRIIKCHKKYYSTYIDIKMNDNIKVKPPLSGYLYLVFSDRSIIEYILNK